MEERSTLVGVKVDLREGQLSGGALLDMQEAINAHLPGQTRLADIRAEDGRYVYADLSDFSLGAAPDGRTDAYVQGLLAGMLLAAGVEVL